MQNPESYGQIGLRIIELGFSSICAKLRELWVNRSQRSKSAQNGNFLFAPSNNGHLPGTALTVNEMCPLTVHPRIGKGLNHCPYSHILNRQIKSARIAERKCPTEMIIFNHPAHPKTKPSANDRRTLSKAVEATGVVGLTVQRLLNASSTSLIYEGERVAAVAPAFMDHRRVRKKKDYPRGMGWDDFGLNSFNSTGEFLNFLDDPEFFRHLEMDTAGSYSVADLPPLPMPVSSSPIAESSSRIPADQDIQVSRKKRTREPEVDEANIIQGSRQRTHVVLLGNNCN
ncbi:hypothetical protein C8J57DRAFT_1253138 [Mycena rebaudengoi]|nr:hypothetical protein C8J57DRAFT_1253138 [Mycena rebaudengoi]